MLILCYGTTKSGSTLAFELIKGMLESAGHGQERLEDGPVTSGHRINFLELIKRSTLRTLLATVGDRWIAVKSHSPITDETFFVLERLIRRNHVRVVTSYRDPRELCLSLLDAGVKARALGVKEFSEFVDLETTTRIVLRKLGHFQKWGALCGALRLDYDLVAFSPDRAMDRLEQYLGIQCERKHAKRHAFEKAFTQKNKAKPNRALEEFSPEQYEALTATFSQFLKTKEDDSWYADLRAQALARARTDRQRLERSRHKKSSAKSASRRKRAKTS